VSALNV